MMHTDRRVGCPSTPEVLFARRIGAEVHAIA